MNLFEYLDHHAKTPQGKLLNQLLPVGICVSMLALFIAASWFFIEYLINPFSAQKILIHLRPVDFFVGFFLYFVTAIDYALIVGRMQVNNPGSFPRVIMNVGTCLGCFVGVSMVLFLWGFAKEIPLLIIVLLVFAGSVMVKLAYEGKEYFENAKSIPAFIRKFTVTILTALHAVTTMFTFWIPELGSPKVVRMTATNLAKWSFFLPFIIGTDDLVGYMGAMTIYNVFSLLCGIYLADIIIDILIFLSPSFTKKLVENAYLSLIAAIAFLYLAYKSYSESLHMLHVAFHFSPEKLVASVAVVIVVGLLFWKALHNKKALQHIDG